MNDWRNARIEEAAKAMADGEHNVLGWRGHSEDEREWYRKDAAIALAVFEKALGEATVTPTDDEREALRIAELDARQEAHRGDRTVWGLDYEAAPESVSNAFFRGWDAAVGGGFRRSDVPEPNAASLLDLAHQIGATERSSADFDAATARPLGPEPQGEPSDVQERLNRIAGLIDDADDGHEPPTLREIYLIARGRA